MIATLTSQITEYMGEKAEHEYALMEKVLGRMEQIRQAVQGAEIYEVTIHALQIALSPAGRIG
jgi:hypothetical protein